MLTATALAIFFVPLFFVVVIKLFGGGHREGDEDAHDSEAVPA
jgi:hypothetical protein